MRGGQATTLAAIAALNGRRVTAVSAGLLAYSALLLTEGNGVVLRKRWGVRRVSS